MAGVAKVAPMPSRAARRVRRWLRISVIADLQTWAGRAAPHGAVLLAVFMGLRITCQGFQPFFRVKIGFSAQMKGRRRKRAFLLPRK
jgi:hypothetical protein